ncbi:HEPN domain-containing protein [Ruminococcus sp. AM27-16]|nr:HEPN domain-containing protein [Ruminococcus sp. AM32-17LB]RHT99427.1 HEPN domain-containing protein [Ruminococcus sp. AM27-16]
MNDKKEDLCIYRIRNAVETLGVAALCLESQHYKDSINRSYYAAFYAIKAVLALEEIDFKRHKDAVAYFNKTYVATEIFSRETGKKLGRLKQERESSDYDDFYVASLTDATDQYNSAKLIIDEIEKYLADKSIQY